MTSVIQLASASFLDRLFYSRSLLDIGIDVGASEEISQEYLVVASNVAETLAMAFLGDVRPRRERQRHVAFRLAPYHRHANIRELPVHSRPEILGRATSPNLTLNPKDQSSGASPTIEGHTQELPPGWESEMIDGEEYYTNHNCSISTWIDPRSQKLPPLWNVIIIDGRLQFFNKVTGTISETDPRPLPLPRGWKMKRDPSSKESYYVDQTSGITTWKDPRDGFCPIAWEAIPLEWVPRRASPSGRVYFFNRSDWTTTPDVLPKLSQDWPLTFCQESLSPLPSVGNLNFMDFRDVIEGLPPGWEIRASPYDGRVFFVNHVNQSCTFIDPRFTPTRGQFLERRKGRSTAQNSLSQVQNAVDESDFGDPSFNAPLIEQAMKDLEMRHTRSHHTCMHCSKILLDFRVSTEVWCARNMEDVIEAMQNGCPFFVHLFKYSMAPEDLMLRASGLFLSIERYTKGTNLFNRMMMFDDIDEMDKMGEISHKRRHYYITHLNTMEGRKYGEFSTQTPALRLCGDPNSCQYLEHDGKDIC